MTFPIRMIVTHAGSFHADEVMAVALLQRFSDLRPVRMATGADAAQVKRWINGEDALPAVDRWSADGVHDMRLACVVVRTRDASLLEAATQAPDVAVVDVGGVYDASALNFDHHQHSMTDTWPDGLPLSSTGLVWRWLGQRGDLDVLPTPVRAEIETWVIRPLDAHDNGVQTCALAQQCGTYNRGSEDPDVQYRQFETVLGMMRDALENQLHTATLKHEATQVLTKAWAKARAQGLGYVVMREAHAYHDCTGLLKTISDGQAKMIIIPGQGNRFSVISQGGDVPFSSVCPCPQAWRGRMNTTLDIGGQKTMLRFAHKTGFMCVVEGHWRDAARVAQHIIEHNGLATQARPTHNRNDSRAPKP